MKIYTVIFCLHLYFLKTIFGSFKNHSNNLFFSILFLSIMKNFENWQKKQHFREVSKKFRKKMNFGFEFRVF